MHSSHENRFGRRNVARHPAALQGRKGGAPMDQLKGGARARNSPSSILGAICGPRPPSKRRTQYNRIYVYICTIYYYYYYYCSCASPIRTTFLSGRRKLIVAYARERWFRRSPSPFRVRAFYIQRYRGPGSYALSAWSLRSVFREFVLTPFRSRLFDPL